MQTNVSNGIEQATSKARATMLGAGNSPPRMGRLPWLTLVTDQATASKLLGDILVNWLEWVRRATERGRVRCTCLGKIISVDACVRFRYALQFRPDGDATLCTQCDT